MTQSSEDFKKLLQEIRDCRVCESHLAEGPRPVIRAKASAGILIVGQAPGTRVHTTGIPFNDPSGDRLRNWLDIDCSTFYDESRIAIMPMGLCYPGRNPKGGDLPPRRECAPLWHKKVRDFLPNIQLTLLVGRYSQIYYLGNKAKASGTETIRSWREYLPDYLPLPHPSWRNNTWLHKNKWFESEILPYLRERVHGILRT